MADTTSVIDADAPAQMLDDEKDQQAQEVLLQQMAIAINQAIDAITPKIVVHHGNNNQA